MGSSNKNFIRVITYKIGLLLRNGWRASLLTLATIIVGLMDINPTFAEKSSRDVTVYRDDYGVPHIYAAKEEDGFYALGYSEAEDQLEVILKRHLISRGEAAEVLGPDHVNTDLLSRMWMRKEEGKAAISRLSPQLRLNYEQYVAGVNRYMEEHPDKTPDWARPVELLDVVVHTNSFLWFYYQVYSGMNDCRQGGIKLSAQVERELVNSKKNASNQWVVAPWRTADNAMFVLADPHGGIDGGSFAYESRIHAGDISSAGYSIGPMLFMNHTRNVSWGLTTGNPDESDCYEIDVDPNDPRRYQFDGEWKEMATRDVTIDVAGGEGVKRTFEYTRHNGVMSPVVARVGNKAYVVSTSYMDQAGKLDEEYYKLNLVKNVKEAREALKTLGGFPINIMIGDKDGGSYQVRFGRAPRRPAGYNWQRPVPGNTSKTAWQGIHPLEDLVQIMNPSQGYMQNNNISPDMMMVNSPLTEDLYPDYIWNNKPILKGRGIRAVEVLSRAVNFTIEDAIDLALDEKWAGSELWLRTLKNAFDHQPELVRPKSTDFKRVLRGLLHFDGFARAESVEALHYDTWRQAVFSLISAKDLGGILNDVEQGKAIKDEFNVALLKAVQNVVNELIEQYGTVEYRLGDVYRLGRGGENFPIGGITIGPRNSPRSDCRFHDLMCVMTLRAFSDVGFDGGKTTTKNEKGERMIVAGSRMLLLTAFTNPIQSFSLHNFGQNPNPDSPYYVDQARLSSERRLKPIYFEKDELMKHVVSTKVIDPRE